MSFVPPKTHPDSYDWLKDQNPESIPVEHFMACAMDYARFYHGIGKSVQEVGRFVQPGDLQTLSSVVSDWPRMEGAPRKPNMADLLTSIAVNEGAKRYTFAEAVDLEWQRCRKWLADKNYDPDNPNETAKERSNRLAAARMRKYRGKLSETDIQDAEEMNLVRALRAAKDNAAEGRKYVRRVEAEAKQVYDAAIAQAKLARAQTVSAAQAWLPVVDKAVADAEAALIAYRIA